MFKGPTEVVEGAFTDTDRAPFTTADFRFTTKGDALYTICLAWPGETATIRSLGSESPLLDQQIAAVELLGAASALSWSVNEQGLHAAFPDAKPCAYAYTLKILLK